MRVGFVLNPVAGMGGRVGLKGTDGKVDEALERGAEPRAPDRGRRALEVLAERTGDIELLCWQDPMGAAIAREAGFDPTVLGGPEPAAELGTGDPRTTAADTRAAVEAFLEAGVDLVLFVGGDGTAADVAETLEGSETPMLGVPAGVKVYSSVFAVSPEDAAAVVDSFERTERREVMDIDEDEYRDGEVSPRLRAVAFVPVTDRLQASKQSGGGSVESLAAGVAEEIREHPERTYVLGPGSTLGAIKDSLGFDGSPIGIDVWSGGEVVVKDATTEDLLNVLNEPDSDGETNNIIVVTPIGGQGFIFGRGNPQLSPAVIKRCSIEIVASGAKLDDLRVLRVDTDDPSLDEELRGWVRVRVGKFQTRMMKIV